MGIRSDAGTVPAAVAPAQTGFLSVSLPARVRRPEAGEESEDRPGQVEQWKLGGKFPQDECINVFIYSFKRGASAGCRDAGHTSRCDRGCGPRCRGVQNRHHQSSIQFINRRPYLQSAGTRARGLRRGCRAQERESQRLGQCADSHLHRRREGRQRAERSS